MHYKHKLGVLRATHEFKYREALHAKRATVFHISVHSVCFKFIFYRIRVHQNFTPNIGLQTTITNKY